MQGGSIINGEGLPYIEKMGVYRQRGVGQGEEMERGLGEKNYSRIGEGRVRIEISRKEGQRERGGLRASSAIYTVYFCVIVCLYVCVFSLSLSLCI